MSTQNTEQSKSASQIVANARKAIPEVTVAQVKEELNQGQVGLLLDVREPAEWEKGHLPGAVLAPRGMLEWYADPTTPYAKAELTTMRDARIIVACASGDQCWRQRRSGRWAIPRWSAWPEASLNGASKASLSSRGCCG